MEAVLDALRRALARGESVALVTIIRAHGSTPQRVGAKMLVFADGRTVGTIGGGCYEHDAFWKARGALESRQVRRHPLRAERRPRRGDRAHLRRPDGRVHRANRTRAAAVLLGAGHVGYQLGQIAPSVGSGCTSPTTARSSPTPRASPPPTRSSSKTWPEWTARAEIPASSFVVVLTRGHRQDLDVLRALAGREFRYVGLIGSKAKVARLTASLIEAGVPADWIQRLHAPIGFDIGAISPEEIAVSILAELIAVRRGKANNPATTSLSMRWTAIK